MGRGEDGGERVGRESKEGAEAPCGPRRLPLGGAEWRGLVPDWAWPAWAGEGVRGARSRCYMTPIFGTFPIDSSYCGALAESPVSWRVTRLGGLFCPAGRRRVRTSVAHLA